MKKKIKKMKYKKILIFAIAFLMATAVFSDWEHFKEGLMGGY